MLCWDYCAEEEIAHRKSIRRKCRRKEQERSSQRHKYAEVIEGEDDALTILGHMSRLLRLMGLLTKQPRAEFLPAAG